tara:strand:- start:105167 stop:106570 length:1404 start_codon:yes stop_codon:yes gene_type:complete
VLPSLLFSQNQIGDDIPGQSLEPVGYDVSISSDGNFIAVSSPFGDTGNTKVFENISGVWSQVGQTITGDIMATGIGFSNAISSDGSIVATSDIFGEISGFTGLVRVFENISGVWTQIGEDIYGDAGNDNFGRNIALSSNGNILAVGAPFNDNNGNNTGQVKVYENISGEWTQLGGDIGGENELDRSGWGVSLSSDGLTVAIGSTFSGNGGQVRVFKYQSGNWTQVGQNIDGISVGGWFGRRVSLSSDGSVLAIGSPFNVSSGGGEGHVQVYEQISGAWVQKGQDIYGEFDDDFLGYEVSMSANGSVLAVATPASALSVGFNRVKIFKFQSGSWVQAGNDINGEADDEQFGASIALSSDGSTVVIGAPDNNENGNSGAVRVFDVSGILNTGDIYTNEFSIYPNPATDTIVIDLKNEMQLKEVNIYNALGQLVLKNTEKLIDVDGLSKGSYVLEVISNTGKTAKPLLIK